MSIVSRRAAGPLLAALCIVLFALASAWLAGLREDGLRGAAFPFALVAGVLVTGVMLAVTGSASDHAPLTVTPRAPAPPLSAPMRWAKRLAILSAVIYILLLIEINGKFLGVFLRGMRHHGQFMLLVTSIPLLVWGFSAHANPFRARPRLSRSGLTEAALLLAVTLFALALRLHDLEAVRAFVDESNFLRPMFRLSSERNVPLLQPFGSYIAFPYIYPYFQSVTSEYIANGLTGIRIPSVIFGTLTIPALYGLARQLFDRRVAFTAAVLLATLPVHLHWSRLGMNNIADALFGVLMLSLLLRGVRRGGLWHFALAGVCLGFTQYFYEGGRLFFPILACAWLAWLYLITGRGYALRDLRAFGASAILIGLPIYTTLFAIGYSPTVRYGATRVPSLVVEDMGRSSSLLFQRFEDTLLTFTSRPEGLLYYGGDHPYIHAYLMPALLIGLAVIVWRWRTAGGMLLILWTFGIFGAVAFLMNGHSSARLLNIFPALMLIAALGLVTALRALTARHRHLQTALLVAVLAPVSVLNTAYYFGILTERLTFQHYAERPEQEIAFHMRDLPQYMEGHFITTHFVHQWDLELLARAYNPRVTLMIPSFEELDEYIDDLAHTRLNIFYLIDGDVIALHKLMQRFELRGPLRWHNPYAPEGIEYVVYFASADLKNTHD